LRCSGSRKAKKWRSKSGFSKKIEKITKERAWKFCPQNLSGVPIEGKLKEIW
jgi:hypothetical protein